MVEVKKIESVYFIGIGGIGMSAIARYYNAKGVRVSGYDKTRTVLTIELEEEGIPVHYEENLELIPRDVDMVVYTPAIPKEHEELVFFREHGYSVVKRSDVLELITKGSLNICVAGTHGKTTITTMIAHLLRHSGYGCNAFLGGIAVNYGTNFWQHERNLCVVEADEYDRSFLKLSPDIAVISAMDADHLDIYGTAEAMEDAFIEFSGRVKEGGLLVSRLGLKREKELKGRKKLTYSLQDKQADSYAANIRMKEGSYEYDVKMAHGSIDNVVLHMGGMHNVENSVAAITVASSLGIGEDKIKEAVESFRGVKRRFEYIIKTGQVVFIDDYAHHPEELRALINGAKSLFPQRECIVIFQPHLYTRTRDLAEGFAEVLGIADEVVLLPIYPAREEPIPGISSEMIAGKMKKGKEKVLSKTGLTDMINKMELKQDEPKVLITAGAGDIDMLVDPIKKILEEKLK